jgi:lipopolysaccharide/colanic/teichoic acid biosynthesis glycosyltransferase
MFDLTVLVAAHVMLAPLWALLWTLIPLAIKLDDRGPVFYSQKRMGRDGKLFTVRKFRSMVIDAEKATGAVWAGRDDPRITRVGRILRKTAMDELPQVLNIWKGEMSIVGPRPERPELHAQFVKKTPDFGKRLQARPGMAGMAQVYGNYDSLPPEKLAYDLAYIRSMSLRLDVKLITLAVLNTVMARWSNAAGAAEVAAGKSEPAMSKVVRLELADAQAEAGAEEQRQAA